MTEPFTPPTDDDAADHPRPAGAVAPASESAGEQQPDQTRFGLSPGARAFFDWVVVVGVALLVAILVRTFLLAHFVVEGESMYSTLDPGDRVFVNKMSYRLHDPESWRRRRAPRDHRCQRTRSDQARHRPAGRRDRDGELRGPDRRPGAARAVSRPDRRHARQRCGQGITPTVVPEGHVFVMGDNRAGSHDSRALGTIPFEDLVGRAFVVFWPKSDWQWL